jgi:voltage-gated potassium channel Kch
MRLLAAVGVMGLCVTIHAAGLSWAIKRLRRRAERVKSFWGGTRLFTLAAAWIVVLHLAEILAFGIFYAWRGAMPDLTTAAYFSAVTYTTTGYGDLVLPQDWRLVGAIEALTGILMCGWSTAFFLAIVSRLDRPPTVAEPQH